jgi:hypothetical protein
MPLLKSLKTQAKPLAATGKLSEMMIVLVTAGELDLAGSMPFVSRIIIHLYLTVSAHIDESKFTGLGDTEYQLDIVVSKSF